MVLKKEPFRNYRLDEDKADDKSEVISLRLNKQERAWLEELKLDLNIKTDGKALKMAAYIGRNVIHSTLGRKNLRYLTSGERVKLGP